VDAIEDWRDANDAHRANGAESDDTYLKLPIPYRARNGNFQDAAELLQVKGVTPEMYYGTPEKPGLGDIVTVRGTGRININTASRPVLEAAGLAAAEINDVMQGRASNPCGALGRFSGRGQLGVGSQTFRIEAEGWINGRPKTRILTVVQRTGGRSPSTIPAVTVFTWRVLPPRGITPNGGTQG
jgi:type II secretory pathway component PulK